MPQDQFKVKVDEIRETAEPGPGRTIQRVTVLKYFVGRFGPFTARIAKDNFNVDWARNVMAQRKAELEQLEGTTEP